MNSSTGMHITLEAAASNSLLDLLFAHKDFYTGAYSQAIRLRKRLQSRHMKIGPMKSNRCSCKVMPRADLSKRQEH